MSSRVAPSGSMRSVGAPASRRVKNTRGVGPRRATADWIKRRSRKRPTAMAPYISPAATGLLFPLHPIDEEALVRRRGPAQLLARAIQDRDLVERDEGHRRLGDL